MSSEARPRVKCGVEGCEADREVSHYCKCCYKKLWRRGEAGHSLLAYDDLKPPLRRAARVLGSYSALDRMLGLSQGQIRALLTRNKRIHVRTADHICTRLGLDFNAIFRDQEVA